MAQAGWIGPVPSRQLHLAGGLGPMVAAMLMAALHGGRPALGRLGKRCLSGGRWLIVGLVLPAALFLVAAKIIALFYGQTIEPCVSKRTIFMGRVGSAP